MNSTLRGGIPFSSFDQVIRNRTMGAHRDTSWNVNVPTVDRYAHWRYPRDFPTRFMSSATYFYLGVDRELSLKPFFQGNFNLMGRACITLVQDQGPTPNCVLFSLKDTVSAYESILYNRPCVNFSAQHLCDCVHLTAVHLDDKGNHRYTFGNGYTFGHKKGFVDAGHYHPYISSTCFCRPTQAVSRTFITGFSGLGCDMDQACHVLKNEGTLTAVILATDSLYSWTSGDFDIFDHEPSDANQVGVPHAVMVLGCGRGGYVNGRYVDEPYFIIKNSWGVQWGYCGFAKVKADLLEDFMFPKVERRAATSAADY